MERLAVIRQDAVAWLRRVAEAWDQGAIAPSALFPTPGGVGAQIVETIAGSPTEMAAFLAYGSLRPALETYFAQARSNLGPHDWALGVCPFCGAPAAFSDVLEDGRRRLACHLCGGDWFFPRTKCPTCASERSEDLLRLEPESQDQGYVIIGCGACRGYLKLTPRVRWNGQSALVEDWGSPTRPHRALAPKPAARSHPDRPGAVDLSIRKYGKLAALIFLAETLRDAPNHRYVAATGLALAYLVQRDELLHRVAALATLAAWILHTGALIALAIDLGRPPFGSLPEAVSVSAWVVVLLDMWLERRYGLSGLGAFVLPVALALSLQSTSIRPLIGQTLSGAWVWVHIGLALVGIAAFVFNFAGALMYLLQERQLRAKRPGALYYSLPALATLDRLTYRTLALGFPFLTTGLLLGVLWAASWSSVFAFDPVALLSYVAWAVYAATLAGRAVGGWHGRRAAYFAILGFAALALTLGAGLFLPGRHGG
jgi:ABC-type uncharacterized transport system permease subunit